VCHHVSNAVYLIVHNPKIGNNSIANMLVNTARPTCNPWLVFSPLSSRSVRGYVWLKLLLLGNLYLLCTVITKLYHNAMFPPCYTLGTPKTKPGWSLAGRMEKCILKMGVRKTKPSRNHSCRLPVRSNNYVFFQLLKRPAGKSRMRRKP